MNNSDRPQVVPHHTDVLNTRKKPATVPHHAPVVMPEKGHETTAQIATKLLEIFLLNPAFEFAGNVVPKDSAAQVFTNEEAAFLEWLTPSPESMPSPESDSNPKRIFSARDLAQRYIRDVLTPKYAPGGEALLALNTQRRQARRER